MNSDDLENFIETLQTKLNNITSKGDCNFWEVLKDCRIDFNKLFIDEQERLRFEEVMEALI